MEVKLYDPILHLSPLDSLWLLFWIFRRTEAWGWAVWKNVRLICCLMIRKLLNFSLLSRVWIVRFGAHGRCAKNHRLFWAVRPLNLCILKRWVVFLNGRCIKLLSFIVHEGSWFWFVPWEHVEVNWPLLQVVLDTIKVKLAKMLSQPSLLNDLYFFLAKIHFAFWEQFLNWDHIVKVRRLTCSLVERGGILVSQGTLASLKLIIVDLVLSRLQGLVNEESLVSLPNFFDFRIGL